MDSDIADLGTNAQHQAQRAQLFEFEDSIWVRHFLIVFLVAVIFRKLQSNKEIQGIPRMTNYGHQLS